MRKTLTDIPWAAVMEVFTSRLVKQRRENSPSGSHQQGGGCVGSGNTDLCTAYSGRLVVLVLVREEAGPGCVRGCLLTKQ